MLPGVEKLGDKFRVVLTVLTSVVPFLVIAGLLYATVFVKASAVIASVEPPAIERRDRFMGVAMPTEKIIWAAGSGGKVVRSDDAGGKWTVQSLKTGENFQGIAAWSPEQAVAVGNGGVVFRTDDAGKSWKAIDVPKSEVANKFLNVRAYDKGIAWAVGEMGALLKTADYGVTWQRAMPEKDQAWNDVSFSGKRGLAVGEFGQIALTEDDGVTWQVVASGSQSSLMSVAMRDDVHAVAVGLSGSILVTKDGGRHWTVIPPKTREHINSVIWDGQKWVAVGDKGVWVKGDQEGADWTISRVSEGNLAWFTQVVHMPGKEGQYVLAGALLASMNSGNFKAYSASAH